MLGYREDANSQEGADAGPKIDGGTKEQQGCRELGGCHVAGKRQVAEWLKGRRLSGGCLTSVLPSASRKLSGQESPQMGNTPLMVQETT